MMLPELLMLKVAWRMVAPLAEKIVPPKVSSGRPTTGSSLPTGVNEPVRRWRVAGFEYRPVAVLPDNHKKGGTYVDKPDLRADGPDRYAGTVTPFAVMCPQPRASEGIAVRVIDLFSVKPIDEQTLRSSGSETKNVIITVEDHAAWGGIGDAVAGAVAPLGIRVHQLGVREVPRSGKPEELLATYGIDRTAIVRAVRSVL